MTPFAIDNQQLKPEKREEPFIKFFISLFICLFVNLFTIKLQDVCFAFTVHAAQLF